MYMYIYIYIYRHVCVHLKSVCLFLSVLLSHPTTLQLVLTQESITDVLVAPALFSTHSAPILFSSIGLPGRSPWLAPAAPARTRWPLALSAFVRVGAVRVRCRRCSGFGRVARVRLQNQSLQRIFSNSCFFYVLAHLLRSVLTSGVLM